jgi:RNA polymerase sigma-70 factor, ECF subfamily
MKAASETPAKANHGAAGGEGVQDDLPALLHAAGMGDDRAWRRIIDLYARRVYALARSRLGVNKHELAEEITQSVFATVATKLGREGTDTGEAGYAEQGKFESWLFRIAMNRIRDEVRRSRRQAEPADPSTFGSVAAKGDPTEAGAQGSGAPDQLHSLRRAMEKLSEADREIVELRHHAGLSFKQMADLLSEPIGTLLARHHRALKKLRDLLTTGDQHFGTERTT